VSTADHAGRPVSPSASGRGPYADGGNAGAGRSGGGGPSALRRLAGSDPAPSPSGAGGAAASAAASREATRPVPVERGASAPESGTSTTALPKYPVDSRSRSGQDRNGRAGEPAAPVPAPAPQRRAADSHAPARPAPARRVRLTVSRIDPWSAMKMSFLLSVALGIAMVVMVAVLWTILEGMGVFDQVNGVIGQVVQDGSNKFDILDFIGFTRVVSLTIVIAVVDVILFTAIATLGAFLYNVSSALVGGVQLTLTDD
jgi:hypothetical protein